MNIVDLKKTEMKPIATYCKTNLTSKSIQQIWTSIKLGENAAL